MSIGPSILENPGRLPVSEVLEGIVDCVLWISVISSVITFSMSMNLFFVVSQIHHVRVASKSRSTSGFAGTRGY